MSGTREHQEMSTTSKNLFTKVRRIVPPLLEKFHKGQQGRVAVIGGSADYTGAPYFSAIASAKLGCDMSHVICAQSAAQVIKSYSPNLMVHPILQSSESLTKSTTNPMQQNPLKLAEPIISMMPRLHVLVIGPGLGRDPISQKVVAEVIKNARSQKMPVVLDADGIQLVQEDPDLVRGFHECIITPNVVEFGRLAKALGVDISVKQDVPGQTSQQEFRSRESEACERLSSALGGVLIIQKGKHDVISNGITSIITDIEGGRKRSGGQGDTLTGSLGTLLAWRKAYHEKLWDAGEKDLDSPPAETREAIEAELTAKESDKKRLSPRTTLLLVAWAGSAITRECSRRAFVAKGRSMQASDLTDEVHESFLSLIGEPEASKL